MLLPLPPRRKHSSKAEVKSLSTTKSQQDNQEKEKVLSTSGQKVGIQSDGEEDREGGLSTVKFTEASDTLGQKEQYESAQQMGPVAGSNDILGTSKFTCRQTASK